MSAVFAILSSWACTTLNICYTTDKHCMLWSCLFTLIICIIESFTHIQEQNLYSEESSDYYKPCLLNQLENFASLSYFSV